MPSVKTSPTKPSSTSDELLDLDGAAAALGISSTRLLRWMENNDWLILGMDSYDAVPGQVLVTKNLAFKNGVRVTAKGMAVLREAFHPVADAGDDPPVHAVCAEGDIPF